MICDCTESVMVMDTPTVLASAMAARAYFHVRYDTVYAEAIQARITARERSWWRKLWKSPVMSEEQAQGDFEEAREDWMTFDTHAHSLHWIAVYLGRIDRLEAAAWGAKEVRLSATDALLLRGWI